MTDFEKLALELIDVQFRLLQVPAKQALSKIAKGEQFVLNYLAYYHHHAHPKELSQKMAVSSARIASLLNHLESKKLVQRLVDPRDCRQIIVVLTEQGQREAEAQRAKLMPRLIAMLEKLGPEDAEAFVRIQNKIYNTFQKSD